MMFDYFKKKKEAKKKAEFVKRLKESPKAKKPKEFDVAGAIGRATGAKL